MFLLFLGLGTASVNAQVRIGGNAAPNASAVLDLNANDTNNGTKGLALPRVALTSNTMLLPGVTTNLTGIMVYNTSTTGTGVNTIGIYFWNGATWVKASLPSTSAADSGKFLMSNGSTAIWTPTLLIWANYDVDTLNLHVRDSVRLSVVLDTTVSIATYPNQWTRLRVTGLAGTDWCRAANFNTVYQAIPHGNTLYVALTTFAASSARAVQLRCYRAN